MPENLIKTCVNDRINIVNNGNGNYVLNVIGTLWDENIVKLSSQWGQQYVSDLINACITVQLLQNNIIINGINPNTIIPTNAPSTN